LYNDNLIVETQKAQSEAKDFGVYTLKKKRTQEELRKIWNRQDDFYDNPPGTPEWTEEQWKSFHANSKVFAAKLKAERERKARWRKTPLGRLQRFLWEIAWVIGVYIKEFFKLFRKKSD